MSFDSWTMGRGATDTTMKGRFLMTFPVNWTPIELPLTDRRYTWTNMSDDPSLAKLDRAFISEEWETCFPMAFIWSAKRPTSDHTPICMNTGENKPH